MVPRSRRRNSLVTVAHQEKGEKISMLESIDFERPFTMLFSCTPELAVKASLQSVK